LGHKHSNETKKKMSEAHKGKKLSKEHREIIRRNKIGKKCRVKTFIFTDPEDNNHFITGEFVKFCNNNELSIRMMQKTLYGERKKNSYKGWKIKYYEEGSNK